ncbi:MAG TPA: rhomboid family intramembrane serine protease [Pseudomonadales bacterium]|nr:rhomboid family intramembrane serine protease [Pseudomonadales bacterium]
MLLIPLHAHAELGKRPLVTMIVCVICVLVFFAQYVSRDRHDARCSQFIKTLSAEDKQIVDLLIDGNEYSGCYLFERVSAYGGQSFPPAEFRHAEPDIAQILKSIDVSEQVLWDKLLLMTEKHDKAGISSLDDTLSYHYSSWNIFQMISSIFAHANFEHIFFNLVFFWAFGCAVEMLIGSRWMIILIIAAAIFESVIFNYAYQRGFANTTLGLSGVCMCMMGVLFAIYPKARIKTFFWFLNVVRVVPIPAYWFAIWYVGWDIYDARHMAPDDNTNHSAHLSGAFVGAVFGLFYRLNLTDREAREKPVDFYD